jgi:hypothetical protein
MNSKYQHQQFITNLLETIDFIFFTQLTIECKYIDLLYFLFL